MSVQSQIVQYIKEMMLIMTKKQSLDFIQNCINSIKNSSDTEKKTMREVYYHQNDFGKDIEFETLLPYNFEDEMCPAEIIQESSITIPMDIKQHPNTIYENALNEASINDLNDFAA